MALPSVRVPSASATQRLPWCTMTRAPAGVLLVLLPLAVAPGCAIESFRLDAHPRATAELTPEVAARFDYLPLREAELERLAVDEPAARVWSGSLTVRLHDDPEPVPVQFEYWQARSVRKGAKAPAIVITPILGGGRSLAVSHCRAFTEAGMHAVLVERGTKVLSKGWPVEEVERQLRRAVVGRRGIVDWLERQPEVDPERLGAFGISMGGILTSVLLATEPRLASGVIALAGGDVPGIISRSEEGRLVTWRETKSRELGVDEAGVERLLRAALSSDPAAMAPFVDPRRVLFVSTRWDDVVPSRNQVLLWEALGRPQRYDLPAGHYSGIVFLPWVMNQAVRWLDKRFRFAGGAA